MFGNIGFLQIVILLAIFLAIGFPLVGGLILWIGLGRSRPTIDSKETEIKEITELPLLEPNQRLVVGDVQVPRQRLYRNLVFLPTVVLAVGALAVAVLAPTILIVGLVYAALLVFFLWVAWRLFQSRLLGHAIQVTDQQYPQIFRLIDDASAILDIKTPTAFIMQGHGMFETFIAKRFGSQGVLIMTSNLVDELTERGSSRELMFYIGRQLGLMATGYFQLWFFKDIIGRLILPFYLAYQRRCHYTADRLGLLVAGELMAAEQALITITVGGAVAPTTSVRALERQCRELHSRYWSWVLFCASSYPFMVDRILALRKFAVWALEHGIHAKQPIGALPLAHGRIRSLPLLIIHGHDTASRLELENFLLRKLPHVAPVTMILEAHGASTIAEKFDELAARVSGAVALLTPDDVAVTLKSGDSQPRARQNVVIEIGWVWGRFGRDRCLLLMKDSIEIPSDLQGVEVFRYRESPVELSETVRDFVRHLEV